jgi:uncharacterized GH25 family protein
MRRAWLVGGSLLLGLLAPAVAHYPMLIVEGGPVWPLQGKVEVLFTIGHPFANDRFETGPPTKVTLFSPGGRETQLGEHVKATTVQFEGKEVAAHRLEWQFKSGHKPGDYVLAWELPVLEEKPHRKVQDFAKLVLHVPGEEPPGAQIGWWQRVKHPIEILPLSRPYWVPVGQAFRGQVVELGAGGKPVGVVGGVVEAETYAGGPTPDPLPELAAYRRAERTDDRGCFSVTLDKAGWWLLSCATDGGPGEQGTQEGLLARRAVMWIHVGPPPSGAFQQMFRKEPELVPNNAGPPGGEKGG